MYFIQGNFGDRGNFEAVIREGNQLAHFWRNNDDPLYPWQKSVNFGNNVDSEPAFIQGNFEDRGNFELVVKEGNKLRHYWRENDATGYPWHQGQLFGNNVDSAPAMIQSNYDDRGSFEVVVKEGNKLRHYWRANDTSPYQWHQGPLFGNNVNSAPALIQGNYGDRGNFEVVVREGNKLRHYWRENDASGYPWHQGTLFGDNIDSAPALIQSNYGDPGNFEVVVKEGNQLRHYWRNNDAPGFVWHDGALFGNNVTSDPSMIQGNFGDRGNFEVLVIDTSQPVHFWRQNDATYPWH